MGLHRGLYRVIIWGYQGDDRSLAIARLFDTLCVLGVDFGVPGWECLSLKPEEVPKEW